VFIKEVNGSIYGKVSKLKKDKDDSKDKEI